MKKLLIIGDNGDNNIGRALTVVLSLKLSVPVVGASHSTCLGLFLEESPSTVLIVHPDSKEAKQALADLLNTGEDFKALFTSFAPTSDDNFQMPYDLEKLVAWLEERGE